MNEVRIWNLKASIQGTLRLWKRSFAGLFPALFLVRLAVTSILYPFFEFTLKGTLRISGNSYVTLQGIPRLLLEPAVWIFLLFWIMLYAVFCFLEQIVIVYSFCLKEQGMEFRMSGLIRFCLSAMEHPVKRGAALMGGEALLQNFLASGVWIAFMLQKLRFPNNLWVELKKLAPVWFLVVVLLVLLCLFAGRQIFCLNYYIIEETDHRESSRRGHSLLRRNRLRTFFLYLLLTAVLTVTAMLLYFLLMTVIAAVLKLLLDDQLVMAKLFAMYDSINLLFGFVLSIVSVFLFHGMAVHLFYQYKDERNELTSREMVYGYVKKTRLKRYILLTRILAAVVVLVAVLSAYEIARNGIFRGGELLPDATITAHRGLSVEAPENTLPALQLAIDQAADYAEIDVRQTADGEIVLMHDLSLKRTCGVSRNLNKVTYEELQRMDAGSWFGNSYRGTKVPTLREAIELCKGNIDLNIEIKTAGDTQIMAEKVVDLIEEYDFEKQCIISSTNYAVLQAVKNRNPSLRTGYIMSMAYGDFYDREGLDFFSIKSSFVTQSVVDRLHENGKEIHVWTVNGKTELTRVRNMGVDSVITDDVLQARQVCFGDVDGTFLGVLRAVLGN